jgi:hypothetical protein
MKIYKCTIRDYQTGEALETVYVMTAAMANAFISEGVREWDDYVVTEIELKEE